MADFDAGAFENMMEDGAFSSDALVDRSNANNYFESKKGSIWKGETKVGDLQFDDNGNAFVKINDGTIVNLTELQNDYNSGNFQDFYDKCGVDGDFTDRIKQLQDSFDQTPSGQIKIEKMSNDAAAAKLKKVVTDIDTPGLSQADVLSKLKTNFGADLANQVGDVAQSFDDMTTSLKNDPNFVQSVEDAKDKPLEEQKSLLKKFSDWIDEKIPNFKSLIYRLFQLSVLAALAYIAYDFVDWLNKISKAMSGCWSYSNSGSSDPSQSGNCKIRQLTCDSDDVNTETGNAVFPNIKSFNICQDCTTNVADPNCGNNAVNTWIPIVKKNFCLCDPNNSNYLVGYNSFNMDSASTNTGQNACQTKCSLVSAPSGITSSCANCSGCVAWNEACASGNTQNSDCSLWCDSSLIQTVPGQVIKCEQGSLSSALAAAFGDIFSLPSGVLGTIEKILIYVAIGIVVIIVIYVIIRIILRFVSKNNNNETVKIEMEPIKSGDLKSSHSE